MNVTEHLKLISAPFLLMTPRVRLYLARPNRRVHMEQGGEGSPLKRLVDNMVRARRMQGHVRASRVADIAQRLVVHLDAHPKDAKDMPLVHSDVALAAAAIFYWCMSCLGIDNPPQYTKRTLSTLFDRSPQQIHAAAHEIDALCRHALPRWESLRIIDPLPEESKRDRIHNAAMDMLFHGNDEDQVIT